MNDTRMRKVTQEKTPDWAGATPLFRLSAAQKVRGVAPARHAGSVTVCCPRAQRELLRRTSETIFPLATPCSRIELNRRAERNRLFSQRHKWPITRNHKLTRHTLRRTQLGSVDADFLHRVTGAASFLRALVNSRGQERFTPVLHGALHRSLHPSAAGKARQVNPISVSKTVGLREGSNDVRAGATPPFDARCCGRSRPHRNFGVAFCALAYTDLRICQTKRLTLYVNTKGEARCLY
jgi:hypothetical protein